MTRKRVIVGPVAMRVERYGFSTSEVAINETHQPADVRQIGDRLYPEIGPVLAHLVWVRHRLGMAFQRRWAAKIAADCPDLRHPGPRPDLIASKPWAKAGYREWTSLPPGIVARILRTEGT